MEKVNYDKIKETRIEVICPHCNKSMFLKLNIKEIIEGGKNE